MRFWPKRGEPVVVVHSPTSFTVEVDTPAPKEGVAHVVIEHESAPTTGPTQTLLEAAAATRAVAEVDEHQIQGEARADFNCAKCQAVHVSLPANSTRCPVTGFKRGFIRLYTDVQVFTGQRMHYGGRKATHFIDKSLDPAFAEKARRDDQARRFEKELDTAHDKGWEKANGEQREAYVSTTGSTRNMRGFGGLGGGNPTARAGAALGAFPRGAREASRSINMPHLTEMKKIVPRYVK